MAKKYTIPKLKTYPLESGKNWYVWFRYDGGNPIRISDGINKIEDPAERILEGQALAKVLKLKLQNDWIPETRQKQLPILHLSYCCRKYILHCRIMQQFSTTNSVFFLLKIIIF